MLEMRTRIYCVAYDGGNRRNERCKCKEGVGELHVERKVDSVVRPECLGFVLEIL
jgi:hypothetical protein